MSTINVDPRVLELVASKICHDLASPVAAVNNGVEFLQDMGADALEDAMGLMSHSASQASVKLQAFRLAFGAGGSDPQMSAKTIYEGFLNYIDRDKVKLEWDLLNDVPDDAPVGYFKVLMNSLLFALDAMPKGGTISVNADVGDEQTLTKISVEAPMVIAKDEVLDAVKGETETSDLNPKTIQPFMLHLMAKSFDIAIDVDAEPEVQKLEMTLTY